MRITSIFLVVLIIVPLMLFVAEYYLAKRQIKSAIILPVVVACTACIVGFYGLIISGIMFLIYFAVRYVEKEKQAKLSEIERMNLEDL